MVCKRKDSGNDSDNGIENIYKFILTGFRDADITFEPETLKGYGNVIEIVDETKPSYDFDRLLEENKGNLLGRYIESLRECEDGSVAHMALYEGVQALLDTKRSLTMGDKGTFLFEKFLESSQEKRLC